MIGRFDLVSTMRWLRAQTVSFAERARQLNIQSLIASPTLGESCAANADRLAIKRAPATTNVLIP